MGSTLTTVAGALKRIQDGGLVKQQNLKHRAIDEIAKSSKKYNAGGAGFYGAINDYGNEAGGAQNETEAFRTIDNENYRQYVVSPKVIAWPINVSGLVAEAADSDDEAFVEIVMDAVDSAKERCLKDMNRQFFGYGSGTLASPSAAVTATALSFTVDTAQYLRANMVVDIYDGATKTYASVRLTRVDKQANVVYFAATQGGPTLKATSQIVKEGIRSNSPPTDGKEAMGLRGIVDDGTDVGTFQNLDSSTIDIWRSVRIAASSANLTSDLLQRLLDDVEVLGGEDPDTIMMHKKQRRKYLDIVVPQKRYNDQKLDAGFAKLSFNGYDLMLDNDCQYDTVYAINKKRIYKFEVSPLKMGGLDGSDTFLRATGYDLFEAYWRTYMNFGTDKRNAHGKISGLAVPSGVS